MYTYSSVRNVLKYDNYMNIFCGDINPPENTLLFPSCTAFFY